MKMAIVRFYTYSRLNAPLGLWFSILLIRGTGVVKEAALAAITAMARKVTKII